MNRESFQVIYNKSKKTAERYRRRCHGYNKNGHRVKKRGEERNIQVEQHQIDDTHPHACQTFNVAHIGIHRNSQNNKKKHLQMNITYGINNISSALHYFIKWVVVMCLFCSSFVSSPVSIAFNLVFRILFPVCFFFVFYFPAYAYLQFSNIIMFIILWLFRLQAFAHIFQCSHQHCELKDKKKTTKMNHNNNQNAHTPTHPCVFVCFHWSQSIQHC